MTTTEEILSAAHPEQSPVIPLPVPKDRKLRGKIAELPKSQRDQVNRLLEDGATYKHISEIMLVEHQVDLNAVNLHNWFNSGFQDYTRAQERLAELRLLREGASDLMQDHDILSFHKAVNQLAVGQIFKTLMNDTLKDDPTNRTRTMNALSRLSREALVFKKYEDALAKEQPDLSSKAGGTDSPSKEELDRQLLDKSDDFFGLKSPARLRAEWQAAASAQSSKGKDAVLRVPIISGVDNPGKDEEKPNLGPGAPEISPQNPVGNSSLDLNSSLEIRPSSLPGFPNRNSKIQNRKSQRICHLRFAICHSVPAKLRPFVGFCEFRFGNPCKSARSCG